MEELGNDFGGVADAISLLGAPGLTAMVDERALPIVSTAPAAAASPAHTPIGGPVSGPEGTTHGHHELGEATSEEEDPYIANLEKLYAKKLPTEVSKRMRTLTA